MGIEFAKKGTVEKLGSKEQEIANLATIGVGHLVDKIEIALTKLQEGHPLVKIDLEGILLYTKGIQKTMIEIANKK